jgi:ATP-binding cassette, subfamily B, bacterial MsbA
VLVVPLIGILVWYVGKRYRRISGGIQTGMGDLAQSAEQSLAAHQEVKIHGAHDFEQTRYSQLANRILRLNVKVETTRAMASGLVQILAAIALAAIVWVATREALQGRLNPGEFVMLMTAMMMLFASTCQTLVTDTAHSIHRIVGACGNSRPPNPPSPKAVIATATNGVMM